MSKENEGYGSTLNLPATDFPMRAGLPKREPDFLTFWKEKGIYQKKLKAHAGHKKFILHDGPPYANGKIHLGHALNKILKDIILKYKYARGFDTPYTPGWDTHGMPIEHACLKEVGVDRHKLSALELRRMCHDYALKWINIQREGFKRLGVQGDWDHPYITMKPAFEAEQIRVFGEMAHKGYIYKGKKTVYWCPHCETALAEAEIEYADQKTPTIYVKIPLVDAKDKAPEGAQGKKTSMVIWTTTPWTIPANVAVTVNPDFEYAWVEYGDEVLIMASELVGKVAEECGIIFGKVLGTTKGRDMEFMECEHPFPEYNHRKSLVCLGDYVDLETGTGCVHTAPGHGDVDYLTGLKYHLDILCPVDEKGCYTDEAGEAFKGHFVFDSNGLVIKHLAETGHLLGKKSIHHQYAHCWRCKNPIIYRASEQWFCSVDGFREDALKAIDNDVQWIPSWGKARIHNMVRDRHDWCISRQRVWGVPIPIFTCKKCGKPLVNEQTIKTVADLFREKGSNAWFDMTAAEILPAGIKCECGCSEFDKETDTMDVWFDSGSSWRAVIENREGQKTPVDVYLEGNDQYRGWFQSSMLTSIATQGKAPYKTVITHGMIVDEERQKMSKSLGNGIAPEDILKQYGADVMRLWVASSDYRQDMRISKDMLKHLSQNYLKIRNTARYILGNLFDFDPKTNAVAYADMPELDKWALMKLNDLAAKVREGYDSYEFHTVFHAIHNFCVVDMSNFYLDVIKDRLYCDETDGLSRRSAQTTIYRILSALVRMLSPILCFTADEIWQAMPHAAEDDVRNVAYNEMPQADEALSFSDEDRAKWDKLTAFRDDVNKALEGARTAKTIGKPLEACVTVYADAEQAAFLNGCGQDLADLCIVSELDVVAGDGEGAASENLPGLKIAVARAAGEKCLRCWKQAKTVGSDAKHPGLCARCAKVVG